MKKLITGLSTFLILFAIGAIVITYFSIEAKKQEVDIKQELIEVSEPDEIINYVEPNDQVEIGIDLYGTYNQNDLIVNEVVENYKGVEVEIPQITGLKNKDIETKINKDIYNRIHEGLEKQSEIESAYFIEGANFANVLSFSYYIQTSKGNSYVSLNYNLVNGENLVLEDLFIKDTNITDLVRKAFYGAIVKEIRYSEEYSKLYADVYDELEVVIIPDENEIYNVVSGYLSNEEKIFSFSSSQIRLYSKNCVANIEMLDIADKISIYTKYLTDESIFVRDDIGYKEIFACVSTSSYDTFDIIKYGYLEDNLWYDISNAFCELPEDVDDENTNKFIEFKYNIYEQVYSEIDAYREVAKNNLDKFYIIISKPDLWMDNANEDGVVVKESRHIYEIPLELYEKTYKERLRKAYRATAFWIDDGVNFYIDEGEDVIYTEFNSKKIYNYITGQEII